jgi:all-trans-8'-apo-beta-carotenal 15,15'-oxygenase
MDTLFATVFESQHDELDRAIESKDVEGELPSDLRGTLLRNGPGIQTAGDDLLNMFDAHAYVAKLELGASPRIVAKHVRTKVFEAEQAAKKQVGRRVFTNMPSRWKNLANLDLANTASHDVYAWGDVVLASLDPGHWALDAKTLETIGEHRWRGAAPEGHVMGPMPRVDRETSRLVCYSIKVGRGRDEITFHELDSNWKSERRASYDLARSFTFIHDIAFTRDHYIVVEAPLALSVPKALFGARTVYDSFAWPKGGTSSVVLFDRGKERAEPVRVQLPEPAMAFHIVNAFERDGETVIDLVTYSGRVNFQTLSPEKLRARQDMGGEQLTGALRRVVVKRDGDRAPTWSKLGDAFGELPEVDPEKHGKPYRFAWFSCPGEATRGAPDEIGFVWFSRIMKLDVESHEAIFYDAPKDTFVSQPAFAARAGGGNAERAEDDGYLLVWELDARAKKTSVVVLDAKDLSFRARVRLETFLPPASHTTFVAATGDGEKKR